MEKTKKNNTIKIIVLAISLTFYNLSIVLIRELKDLDEIWNFNFANNIANGLIPYKDFNMVTMPFLPMIISVFLKIFGQEVIVMRVLCVLMITYIEIMLLCILEKLKVKDYINYLSLIFICYIIKAYITIDYNYFILAIVLTIINIEISQYIKNKKIIYFDKKVDFIIGLLAGFCVVTKQSTGAIIAIITIFYKSIEIRSKSDFIEFIKAFFTRLLGMFIPIFCILAYIWYTGAFRDFISYCILGIKTFCNYKPYTDLIKSSNLSIKILSILVPVILISCLGMYIIKNKKIFIILFGYALASMVVIYPIADNIHFLIGIFPSFIILIFLIDKLINKILRNDKIIYFIGNFLKIGIVLFSILLFLKSGNIYINSNKNYELKHFRYIIMDENYIKSIKEIEEYIDLSEKKVYILDATAALYMIPIDRYNKNYDLFLIGNLGKDGEEGQIKNIKKDTEKVYLIMNDKNRRNWQNPERVRKYIIKNKQKIDEIGVFDVYE